jgi:ribosomal protein S6
VLLRLLNKSMFHYYSDFYELTQLVKKMSLTVVNNGGIVRAIHNHGIRDLPHRFRARYPDRMGNRYYTKGRFFSFYYNCNPYTVRQLENMLVMEPDVLRKMNLRARSSLDVVNIVKEDRNPYIQQVLEEQAIERHAVKQRNETVEQVIEDMRNEDGA